MISIGTISKKLHPKRKVSLKKLHPPNCGKDNSQVPGLQMPKFDFCG